MITAGVVPEWREEAFPTLITYLKGEATKTAEVDLIEELSLTEEEDWIEDKK